jgi:hypothetical protein
MIRIGFGTTDKLHSRLIRWVTRSPWSHVWIEYESAVWDGWWAAHAGPTGVVKVPLEQVHEAHTKRRVYECEVDLSKGLRAVREYVGSEYDYRSVMWNGLLLLLSRVFAREWLMKIVSKNRSKMSCSEFVSLIMKRAGVFDSEQSAHVLLTLGVKVEELDPELVTPGALERFCSDSDDFLVV